MVVSDAWIALIGTIFGGSLLKAIDWLINKKNNADNSASLLRQELREDLHKIKEELRDAENEVDEWKNKYYQLREEYLTLKVDLAQALARIVTPTEEAKLDTP